MVLIQLCLISFLWWPLSFFTGKVFDAVPSNRQDFLSTFADLFVYGAVKIHHKDYLTNNGVIKRFSELYHNLIIISNYHNYL